MKVVLDTNVYLSGTFWEGLARTLIDAARENKFTVFISIPILEEIHNTLTSKKFGLFEDEAFRILRDIRTYTSLVFPTKKLHVVENDYDDDKLFDCADESGATVIVSGDKHVLAVKSYEKIRVYKVRDFLVKINKI